MADLYFCFNLLNYSDKSDQKPPYCRNGEKIRVFAYKKLKSTQFDQREI